MMPTETHRIGKFTIVCPPYLRSPDEYARRKRTDYLVVHCSDTKRSLDIDAEHIRGWHVHEREFMDIGYHFVIKRDGTIERGRPTWSVGAGVNGHNSNSIHICLIGGRADSGKEPEDNFEESQKEALAFLLGYLLEQCPDARVLGHRDFPGVKKACPSFDVKAWWAAQG